MSLPPTERLGAAVARWSLSALELFAETATSWVFRAAQPDGPRALKLIKPYGWDELRGARLLQWYGPASAVEVVDIAGDDVLMKWLSGPPLADMVRADHARDAEATGVVCDLIHALHMLRPEPPKLTSLKMWFRQLWESDLAFIPDRLRPSWLRCRALAEELIATTGVVRPLHGDLHHDNVLGSGDGWRVIDPKGLAGDPHYDVANVFRNPHGADALALNPGRIDLLATTFADRLGGSRRRILQWGCAHSAISAVWDHADGRPFDFDLKMVPLLLDALDRA